MTWLVAIDPDTKTPGVAIFRDGVLTGAYADADAFELVQDGFERVGVGPERQCLVIECPQTYGGRAAGSSDANVLIALARIVGRFEQMALQVGAEVLVVSPREWKGNVPKEITIQRAWDALSKFERSSVRIKNAARAKLEAGEGLKSGLAADAMDAVALGLRAVGRTGRALK